MELTRNLKDPRLALHLAELLNAVSAAEGKRLIDSRLAADTGETPVGVLVEATNYFPSWYAARAGDYSFVLIGGCTTLDHSRRTIEGYRGALLSPVDEPVNAYFRALADSIMGESAMNGLLSQPHIFLAGHSLGGAVVEHMASSLIMYGAREQIRLCTFGAPKPGGSAFAAEVADIDRVRWFTEDDPVPLLPPSPDLLPSLLLVRSPVELLRFSNFVHPRGGIELNVGGTVSRRVLPELASLNATASLAGWLLAIDGSSSSGHHLTTYQSRLAYWIQQQPGADPAALELASVEVPGEVTRETFTEQRRKAVTALVDRAEVQTRSDVDIPPGARFQYQRAGKFHLVTFNGTTVIATTRERSARAVAREGNEWLRSLQKQAIVMTDELAAQFTDYLRKATSSGEGFTPVMNKQLPELPS